MATTERYIDTSIKIDENLNNKLYKFEEPINGNPARVLITAKNLNLSKSDTYYKKYCITDRSENYPYKEIVFACDELSISALCKFPSCMIKIFARKLTFEGEGQIDTSGKGFSDDIGDRGSWGNDDKEGNRTGRGTGKNGQHGYSAGDIHLYCGSIDLSKSTQTKWLIANGGKGQNAQEGNPGSNGYLSQAYRTFRDTAVNGLGLNPVLWNRVLANHYTMNNNYMPNPSAYIESVEYDFNTDGIRQSKKYENKTLRKAEHATEPGEPGRGGNGGNLYINYDNSNADNTVSIKKIIDAFDSTVGMPGATTKNITKPTCYKMIKVKYTIHGFNVNYRILDEYFASNNRKDTEKYDGKSNRKGNKGKVFKYSNANVWLHPGTANTTIKILKDLYLQGGNYDKILPKLNEYEQTLAKVDSLNDRYWKEEEEPVIGMGYALSEVTSMAANLKRGLDYYGNPAGFMPTISFYAAKRFYENELDRAMSTILLTTAIETKFTDIKDQQRLLLKLIEDTEKQMQETEKNINSAWKTIDNLENDVKDLDQREKDLDKKLAKRKEELLEEAKVKEKSNRMVKLAFGAISLVTKAIPVYQPALGAVGGAVGDIGVALASDDVDDADKFDKTAQAISNSGSTLLKTYSEKFKVQVKTGGAQDKLANYQFATQYQLAKNQQHSGNSSIDFEKYDEQKKDLRGTIDKKSQALKMHNQAIAQSGSVFRNISANQSDIDKIYSKLLAVDFSANIFVEQLKKLGKDKKALTDKLMNNMLIISKGEAFLISSSNKLKSLIFKESQNSGAINEGVLSIIKDFKKDAFDKIYRFQYLLIKAYEASFLDGYDKKFATKDFIKSLQKKLQKIDTSDDFFDKFSQHLKSAKLLILAHMSFDDDDYNSIWRGQTTGQLQSYTLRFTKTVRGAENTYVSAINQSNISTDFKDTTEVTFPLSFFRSEKTLSRYLNAKISSIKLKSLSFKFMDNEGKAIKNSEDQLVVDTRVKNGANNDFKVGDDKFIFEGGDCVNISLYSPKKGFVRKAKEDKIVLRAENEWIWTWEYDFWDGERPKDKALEIANSSVDAILEHNDIRKEFSINKALALPPLEGDYRLFFEAAEMEMTQISPNGIPKYLNVRPQLHELELEVSYYARSARG